MEKKSAYLRFCCFELNRKKFELLNSLTDLKRLFFFLALELFILIMKLSDKESDYDKLVDHQMDVRIQMLQRLKA